MLDLQSERLLKVQFVRWIVQKVKLSTECEEMTEAEDEIAHRVYDSNRVNHVDGQIVDKQDDGWSIL